MKAIWITLNLLGLALILFGAIYPKFASRAGVPFVLLGGACMGISNMARARLFRNR